MATPLRTLRVRKEDMEFFLDHIIPTIEEKYPELAQPYVKRTTAFNILMRAYRGELTLP